MFKTKKTLALLGMVILFVPMAFLGWMIFGGRSTDAGMDTMDILEPFNYFVIPAFIFVFVGFYYLMKIYKA